MLWLLNVLALATPAINYDQLFSNGVMWTSPFPKLTKNYPLALRISSDLFWVLENPGTKKY